MLTRHDRCRLGAGGRDLSGVPLAAGRQGPGRPQVPGGHPLLRGPQHHLASAAGHLRQVEQRLEALLAPEPGGRVRGVLRGAREPQPHRSPCADVRLHGGAGARLGGRRQRGQHGQALGRSRGGFSTKIHLKVDLDGLPLAFHLTEGQAGDSPQFEVLLDLGPDITPRAGVGDKGYDSKANRSAARQRGICPVIPLQVIGQEPADVLPESALPGAGSHRATRGQAQALQARRAPLREDQQELRLIRRLRPRPHHRQIRPHRLVAAPLSKAYLGVVRLPAANLRGADLNGTT